MSELRRDPVTGRWVIVAAERGERPNDFQFERPAIVRDDVCPFCGGHEQLTPPEVLAYRSNGGPPNSPGWDVRVVPNKFPALQRDGEVDSQSDGLFERMNGVGVHEVIVETPEHGKTLASMSERGIEQVLTAFGERLRALKRDPRLKYVQIFKNHGGAAGATLEHAHSQLLALPLVPDVVRDELDGARKYSGATHRCVFCDIIARELAAGARVVEERGKVVALAPYAARFPFETWLLPRRHGARFEEAARDEYRDFAGVLKSVLMRIDRAANSPPYNLVLHTAPFTTDDPEPYHWHVEILPTLTRTAGFEWGTGCHINPLPPEEATRLLRAVAF